MRKTDLAYFAGIFDGEGHISLSRQHGKRTRKITFQLIVGMANTNEWICNQMKFTFGGSIQPVESKGNQKPYYQWRIVSRQAFNFLTAVIPYLHLKKAQAEIGLKLQAHKGHSKFPSKDYLDFEQELKVAISTLNRRGIQH